MLVSPAGFEPTAPGLGILCSILLSYGDASLRIAQPRQPVTSAVARSRTLAEAAPPGQSVARPTRRSVRHRPAKHDEPSC